MQSETNACMFTRFALEIAPLMRVSSFGQIAQSVEQGTENPCVLGSIPSLATIIMLYIATKSELLRARIFCFHMAHLRTI